MRQRHYPLRIVSGGQTGVDRAALDAAIALGIDHGGWCPRGRLAEDGTIPARYALTETEWPQYHVRTFRNVVDSDATLILYRGEMTGGTALTCRLAERQQRACWAINLDEHVAPELIRAWIADGQFATLNVAGPRESTDPGIGEAAYALLTQVLTA
jgi:hypothetical protein